MSLTELMKTHLAEMRLIELMKATKRWTRSKRIERLKLMALVDGQLDHDYSETIRTEAAKVITWPPLDILEDWAEENEEVARQIVKLGLAELLAQHGNQTALAKYFGVSDTTVSRAMKEFEVPRPEMQKYEILLPPALKAKLLEHGAARVREHLQQLL